MKHIILRNLQEELRQARLVEARSGAEYLQSPSENKNEVYKQDQGYVNGLLEAIDIVERRE